MKNLAYWLSKRLGKNIRNTGKTGSIIAVLGVAFAVIVMELTLAVSMGFKKEITSKLQGFVPPITLSAYKVNDISSGFEQTAYVDSAVCEIIEKELPGASYVGSVNVSGLLKSENDYAVVAIKGFAPEYQASFEKSNIISGNWLSNNNANEIVISDNLARQLSLNIGDKINFCYFIDERIKNRRFEIVGIYDSGFEEYDKYYVYADYETLKAIYHLNSDNYPQIEIRDVDISKVPETVNLLKKEIELSTFLQNKSDIIYKIDNIVSQGAQYLNWLELLDTNVVVIFILMALVAVCTLISSLFIQVLDKVQAVGILRSLGATNKFISRIFILISLRLVGVGLLIGNIFGLGLIFLQKYFQFLSLDSEMYFLNSVPVNIDVLSIIFLNIGIVAASFLMLYLPAHIAAKLKPNRILQYD